MTTLTSSVAVSVAVSTQDSRVSGSLVDISADSDSRLLLQLAPCRIKPENLLAGKKNPI